MTRRPMLWIAATAVAASTVTAAPSAAGADPGPLWNVTIDQPATGEVASTDLVITGTAERDLILDTVSADSVVVTIVPQGLPESCGSEVMETAPVVDGRYTADVEVPCNGPHQIQVVASHSLARSGDPVTRDIGVAERPETPGVPGLVETSEGGLAVTWQASADTDAVGWVLRHNGGEVTFEPEVTEAVLPPANRDSIVAVRAVRWGAGGPGTTVTSEYSPSSYLLSTPNTTTEPPPSTDPQPPPSSNPPTPSTRPSGAGGVPPSSTTGPTRGTGAPSTTLLEGYSEELPFGAPADAYVPGGEPSRRPAEAEESAVSSSSPVAGLVRTTEKRSPGLVAPFALGLLMITIAAHIAWYLRRSRPTGGQGHPA